jgi:hypothetical protein
MNATTRAFFSIEMGVLKTFLLKVALNRYPPDYKHEPLVPVLKLFLE